MTNSCTAAALLIAILDEIKRATATSYGPGQSILGGSAVHLGSV
jgi:hypothetical protein